MINKFIEVGKIILLSVVLVVVGVFVTTFTHLSPTAVDATPYYISDNTYGSSWNGVVNKSATKNAIYDYLHQIDPDDGGTVDLDELGNPGASKTLPMGSYLLKLTTGTDGAETLEIEDTAASHSSESVKFRIRADCLSTDTNCVLLEIKGDDDGDDDTVLKIVGSSSDPPGWILLGSLILNVNSSNYSSVDNYKVNNVGFNTRFQVAGPIVGELDEIDDGDIASDDLTAAQCRGTLITNEGAAGAVEYDLPTAEAGLHFKAVCAEAQDIHFDANTNDKIYISDDDAITVTDDADQVQMDCANVGESMTCVTFTTDDSAWDWLCECGAGECTDDDTGT